MKEILVTGAEGFIGNHLVNKLKSLKNINIRLFDRKKHKLKEESLIPLVKDCDTIFHLAGKTSLSDPKLFDVNLGGTYSLLKAVKRAAPECFIIFPSSFAVYRLPREGEIIDENFETNPRNEYGLSKAFCEQLLKMYNANYSLGSVVLRVSNVYGPKAKPFGHSIIATFIEQIKNKMPLTINGDGTQTRDFVYVDDVVEGMIAAAIKSDRKKITTINLCSNTQISLEQLAILIQEIAGEKQEIIYNNISGYQDGFWQGDNTLAKKHISWQPKISLEEGLGLTIK